MTNNPLNIQIIEPKKQTKLFGFKYYFHLFTKLYENNRLPSSILLSGQKGLGKSTFIYHFINYLLSQDEKENYSVKNNIISAKNSTFNLIKEGAHPNFFLIDRFVSENDIKIEQSRNLLKFLNKTTYGKDIKIVLIDNAERLNINAANALLKALEEPPNNTYFFIIQNDASKVIDTIKSRCLTFNIYFCINEKKKIFNNIIDDYDININEASLNKFLYFDTHGNILNYLIFLKDLNINTSKDFMKSILFFIDTYNKKKDSNILNLIFLFIEIFYTELSLKFGYKINSYFNNKNKILYLIRNANKFNLDKKNMLYEINNIIQNEAK
tara:strand:- start:638 stop:1612 length:975 start_codon:yes stop_codon:yes gene_type:complete